MVKPRIYIRETNLPSLPEDIILEILYHLPVRSLLRFRCVSKSWCSRISSADFAESHLQMSVRSPNLNSRLLIVSTSFVKSINHHELSLPFTITELDHPVGNPDLEIHVLGSCNGLVCLFVDRGKCIIIYNPSTRHYRSIPLSDSLTQFGAPSYLYLGFGFDSDLHEYKVVREKAFIGPDTDKKLEVEVFSIKDFAHQPTTVRTLSCDFAKGYIHSTLSFNGSFHFLVHRPDSFHLRRKEVIVRLDFAREVFHEVPEPDICNASNRWDQLMVVGGCLSLVSSPHHPLFPGDSIELWVMKEYGVKTSWTKLLSIPTTCYDCAMPLNFKSDREILLTCSNDEVQELSIFNSEESSFEKVFTHNDPRGFDAAEYVESLISP